MISNIVPEIMHELMIYLNFCRLNEVEMYMYITFRNMPVQYTEIIQNEV